MPINLLQNEMDLIDNLTESVNVDDVLLMVTEAGNPTLKKDVYELKYRINKSEVQVWRQHQKRQASLNDIQGHIHSLNQKLDNIFELLNPVQDNPFIV